MSTYSYGVTTSSTAVAAMGQSTCGTPVFIVSSQYGAVVSEPAVPVVTGNSSALVNLTAYTAALPDA